MAYKYKTVPGDNKSTYKFPLLDLFWKNTSRSKVR